MPGLAKQIWIVLVVRKQQEVVMRFLREYSAELIAIARFKWVHANQMVYVWARRFKKERIAQLQKSTKKTKKTRSIPGTCQQRTANANGVVLTPKQAALLKNDKGQAARLVYVCERKQKTKALSSVSGKNGKGRTN